jgi:hypothetical protein
MNNTIFWVMTPDVYQLFEGNYCLNFQCGRLKQAGSKKQTEVGFATYFLPVASLTLRT